MKFSNNTSLAEINSIYSYSFNYVNQISVYVNTLAHYNGEYFDFWYGLNSVVASLSGFYFVQVYIPSNARN